MLISLQAESFRNLEPLEWGPGPGCHLLLGGNGAGKTSLLEAVYVLATTKSFRTAQLADCARRGPAGAAGGSSGFRLVGEASGAAPVALEVSWRREGGKSRAVNGKQASLAEHLEVLPVVAWTAAEAELATGPPELRRRFLDRGVVGLGPAALEVLARYRRALAAKRELLVRPAAFGGRPGAAELAPWNELMATAGARLIALRRAYTERLSRELATVLAEVAPAGREAGFELPAVDLAYRPSPARSECTAEAVLARLERISPRERERRRALVGPHRDELAIRWAGHPLRGNASAGERKALGLLLLAAHGRVLAAGGREPLYLLDDADAELAPQTLAALWPAFGPAHQLLASSNRPRTWAGIGLDGAFSVAAGRVRPTDLPTGS